MMLSRRARLSLVNARCYGSARDPKYYERLGLLPGASAGDIKDAYFRLAKQLHPDFNKSQEAATHFQKVVEAYEVLGTPRLKRLYDREMFYVVDKQRPKAQPSQPDNEPFFMEAMRRRRQSQRSVDSRFKGQDSAMNFNQWAKDLTSHNFEKHMNNSRIRKVRQAEDEKRDVPPDDGTRKLSLVVIPLSLIAFLFFALQQMDADRLKVKKPSPARDERARKS